MRAHFDITPGLLYLAGANQSLTPRAVIEAQLARKREYETNPTQGLHDVWGRLWEIQTDLASFLGADPKDIFLRPNATSVLNTLILGIPLPPHSEILVGELEYGAVVNICRLRVAREGMKIRSLKMPANRVALARASRASLAELVVSQLGPETKLLVLSQALGGTGVVLPVEEIAAETRRRGILFVCDGTHALGAVPVDFAKLADVDFYGVGLYKWMLGPKGTAFGWVAPRHHDFLRATQGGWTTFEAFEPMHGFGGGSRFQEAFLMHGCHDYSPFLAIRELLAFWREQTPRAIFERRAKLQACLHEKMKWNLIAPSDPAIRAPMLVYDLPDRLQARGREMVSRLFSELGLQTTSVHLRERWGLVLSPHVYNSEEEMEKTAKILAGL